MVPKDRVLETAVHKVPKLKFLLILIPVGGFEAMPDVQPVGEGGSFKPLLVLPLLVAWLPLQRLPAPLGQESRAGSAGSASALPQLHFLSLCLCSAVAMLLPARVSCHASTSSGPEPCSDALWHFEVQALWCVCVPESSADRCKLLSTSYVADSSKPEPHSGLLQRAD